MASPDKAGPQASADEPVGIPFAWQPLTPRGVAAFAQAPVGRLLIVQFVVALLTAAVVVWFVHGLWFPVVTLAIGQLPAQGQIRAGSLEWSGDTPARLGENRFLGFTVDLGRQGGLRLPSHIQVEFAQKDLKVFSLLGFVEIRYPGSLNFPFNRPELGPWWGAWAPPILGLIALGTVIGLLAVWAVLATLYAGPVWLIAFFADRELSLGGSWRLAGAGLMPGALLMAAAIFFYGLGTLGLIELFAAFAAHWVIGWVYAWIGALRRPGKTEAPAPKGNPFG
jgi:hypothetical protein